MAEQRDGLTLEVSDGVAVLTLARPKVMNAISAALAAELREVLAELRARADVRALVLTGGGRAFCAGADLRDPALMNLDSPPADRARLLTEQLDGNLNALMRAFHAFDRPKVVAVNGPAVGGGGGLAFIGDIVLAARSAYFAFPFTPQLGLVPDMGASWQLARRLGRARALGLALLGEQLNAEDAERWGLIWRAVDDDVLMGEAMTIATRLAAGPPRAMAMLADCLDAAATNGFDAQLDLERDVQSRLVATEDFVEGVRAFQDKRPRRFAGR